MSHYIKRPEPGRFIREKIVEEPKELKVEKSEILDISAIANAVAIAISANMPKQQAQVVYADVNGKIPDTFDNSNTMSRLADQMLVERGNSKANFKNLGNIQKTKKDQKDVDDTINLLSRLND